MAKSEMEWYDYLLVVLMMAGAIVWLPIGILPLIGMAPFNLLTYLFGEGILTNLIYSLAGIAGLISIFVFPWGK